MNRIREGSSQRIFGLSDLHADFLGNRSWLEGLASGRLPGDVILVAGDVSDRLDRMRDVFALLQHGFDQVFFVPGNHDLWVRRGECADSLAKFRQVLELCRSMGVRTEPARVGPGVWVVPLLSWYVKHDEGAATLYLPKKGEDKSLSMWVDNLFVKWPPKETGGTMAEFFLRLNEAHLAKTFDEPVLSFSHFLPRQELMFPTPGERKARRLPYTDPHPTFNFSSVAGCAILDQQIRRLGSTLHVYGHQHRNRSRQIDGIEYVSHCLGSPKERANGSLGEVTGPRLLWDESGPVGDPEPAVQHEPGRDLT